MNYYSCPSILRVIPLRQLQAEITPRRVHISCLSPLHLSVCNEGGSQLSQSPSPEPPPHCSQRGAERAPGHTPSPPLRSLEPRRHAASHTGERRLLSCGQQKKRVRSHGASGRFPGSEPPRTPTICSRGEGRISGFIQIFILVSSFH